MNVDYGPQYVYNLEHTWLREFNNLTSHGHIKATMKCQNSRTTRLLCQLINPTQRRYTENLNGIIEPTEPTYEPIDCVTTHLCDSFEISFNKYGLKEAVVSRNLDTSSFNFISTFVKLLNVSWINVRENDNGLINTNDYDLMFGKCDVTIKITKEKINTDNINKQFEIDSAVNQLNGMTWNYKKTRNVKKCSNYIWTTESDVGAKRITLKSSIIHVIVSAHQFMSTIENEIFAELLFDTTTIDKSSISLQAVEQAMIKFPAVVDPVSKNILGLPLFLYNLTRQ